MTKEDLKSSDFYYRQEWLHNREGTLLKIIREELSKLDYTPSAILIDGNALSILYKYFEYKVEKYEIDGIKCIRTWDKINYFKLIK